MKIKNERSDGEDEFNSGLNDMQKKNQINQKDPSTICLYLWDSPLDDSSHHHIYISICGSGVRSYITE